MRNIAVKLLISLGVATIFFSIFLFYQSYKLTNKSVGEVVEQQASMALKFDLAIREYIAKNVRPVMYKLLGPDEFMPETMSTSYVARSIFEDVRNEFPDYIIKFASDNPRNPVNKAGPEELKIIEYLNNNPQLHRWEGKVLINAKPYFAKFSAMRMEEACIRCHSNPADAPASLLKRYGSTAGFHRPIGKIIGLDTVAIPMAKISEKLRSELLKTFLVSALGLLLFFITIISVTRFVITNRLTMISKHFKNAAQQEDYSNINPIEIKGKDEIFDLAFSFNTLFDKLKYFYSSLEMQVKERTRELEDTNVQLKQEIGERKQAERALRDSETRFKELFKNMHNGVAVYEVTENGADFVFKDFNRAAEKIEGIKKEELIGKSVLEMFSGVREFGLFDVFQRVWKSGQPEHCPVLHYKDDRILGWRENYVYKLPTGEIVAVYSDETEHKQAEEDRKKLEAQLQQSQKIESIGTLAGGIAHDFNNILFPIMGFAEMALDDVPKDSLLQNNIKEIIQGTKRASDLVKQILSFSREADQKPKPLKVQLIVKEVLKLIRSSIPTTIKIKQDISNECGFVMADASQIHQVAMNLMTNAYQAMADEAGVLEVILKEVELGVDDLTNPSMNPGAYVCLTVADTGIGMDQSTIDRIFEPYFTTKEVDKGTGLGLSVVHGIVKNYGGNVKVYSEPGEGTAFHVYLPVIKSQVKTEEIDAVGPVPRGTERILLVDDEEPIVRMEKQMLERFGYQVTERTSSIEALEAFRVSPGKFNLVITDMTMPNMTGVHLAQKLLEIRPDIPIIICTGFSTKIDDAKAKEFGIRGFVMKPVVMSELGKKVREVLDQEE